MDVKKQRGEGRLGSIVGLLLLGGVGYAGFNAGPVYFAHYELKDVMVEVARLPKGTTSDEKILDRLDGYVRKEGLADFIKRDNFKVTTRDGSRAITLSYERPVKYLPGFERQQTFEASVDQVLLF